MTASNVERDLAERTRRVESAIADVQRVRTLVQPNMRDLRDANLTKVAAGQVPVYNVATGRWDPVDHLERIVFDQAGALVVATSPKYRVWTGGLLFVDADLTTAGSSTSTVRVFRNGVQAGSDITLASGVVHPARLDTGVRTVKDDLMTVQLVTAGTGAVGLSVALAMRG